ncbi:MAG TPA: 2-oxoglutarate dehydrogenase complex dihydrolipoyllysine-residue succinyltransferase [Tepidisphaeraceae bacterium]|jgi:2-oxoglutarate dehydrogenase E2 component (dihydrolipoamide succinyltransferase)
MAIQVKVPALGESVKQATLLKWHKQDGEAVKVDEALCELESDKANADLNAETAGVFRRLKKEGETVNVGEVIAEIDPSGVATAKAGNAAEQKKVGAAASGSLQASAGSSSGMSSASNSSTAVLEDYSPAVRRLMVENQLDPKAIPATGPGGRLTKEDVEVYLSGRAGSSTGLATGGSTGLTTGGNGKSAVAPPPVSKAEMTRYAPPPLPERKKDVATISTAGVSAGGSGSGGLSGLGIVYDAEGISRVPMSRIRKRIAETLLLAQQTAAILTTFNEADLTAIIELRAKFKERFQEVHGVGLGFMSFFARACVLALKEFPKINAFIDGNDVVYHQYVHLGIAVSTERGLAVPVLRHADEMSFAKIESEIKRLATATRDGKLSLDELSGGTFTITNGGVFGSLLSTPIMNPPQSGILGMHAIQKRPMVVNDRIEIRSMMYLALSYDHRLVDGRESVSFLVRLKQYLEDPTRLMLEI